MLWRFMRTPASTSTGGGGRRERPQIRRGDLRLFSRERPDISRRSRLSPIPHGQNPILLGIFIVRACPPLIKWGKKRLPRRGGKVRLARARFTPVYVRAMHRDLRCARARQNGRLLKTANTHRARIIVDTYAFHGVPSVNIAPSRLRQGETYYFKPDLVEITQPCIADTNFAILLTPRLFSFRFLTVSVSHFCSE